MCVLRAKNQKSSSLITRQKEVLTQWTRWHMPSQRNECAFTTKRWPLVLFFNILDLPPIAALIVFRIKYPLDTLSHDDNRQKFNIEIGRSLALPQIICRSAVLTLQKQVQNNITAVLDTLRPSATEDVSNLPAKTAKLKDRKRRRCDRCPSKKDKKTSTTCTKFSCYICPEHSVIYCKKCA